MRLMYLIANTRLTAHFPDNPGFDSRKARERDGEEKRAQDSVANACLWLRVNNLLRKHSES